MGRILGNRSQGSKWKGRGAGIGHLGGRCLPGEKSRHGKAERAGPNQRMRFDCFRFESPYK